MRQEVPLAAGTYEQLGEELAALWSDEIDFFVRAANMAALLFWRLPEVNWVGFYLRDGDDLLLGPFQGRPACQRIPIGRGVCGQAALRRQPIIVPDVSAFPDYIACSPETRAELVVPMVAGDVLCGVVDLDSSQLDRFTQEDAQGIQQLVDQLIAGSDLKRLRRYYRW
ncbi:MAG: GAF domain-containing protein [Candidatus Kapabacteria bacterium]|nr:GAF domain-containing protein [Candidatus Kapabacteria bacterium]MDW8012331.1 GAF domain-containing protein [Bacteroidota bacterium]